VPVIFCAVEVMTGEGRAFWGRDPRLGQFVREHADDLFVSHNLIAEAKYLLNLGVEPPPHWWDSMLAFRFATNAEWSPPYRLTPALITCGLPYRYCEAEKKKLQKWIGHLEFDPDSPDDRRKIRDYCLDDCISGVLLYRHLSGRVPEPWMRHVTTFCLELARMELRGIALDMACYNAVLENKGRITDLVTAEANRTHPVFVGGRLSPQRFFGWCAANGVGWPGSVSSATGRRMLSLDKKTFERMKGRHPFIQAVHEANKTVKQLNTRTLAVDPGNGRHYHGNIPFGAKTGRTSLTRFLFQAPKWMRYLAVPSSPEHRLVSIDFTAEEILIAAWLSSDNAMTAGYLSGDPHMAFAVLAGAAPAGATKKTHPEVRSKYKSVNLGVNYGETEYGLAESTGLHLSEAYALLAQHRRTYPAYWSWVNRYTTRAFYRGQCWTIGGWPRKVSRHDNPRSVANYPVQGAGGDLMRLAVINLAQCGLRLLAVIHDGFLLECHRDELPQVREAVDAALGQAVSRILPGAPMGWDVEVYPDRYRDGDGERLWNLVNGCLENQLPGTSQSTPNQGLPREEECKQSQLLCATERNCEDDYTV
jgi:hypothetical protein